MRTLLVSLLWLFLSLFTLPALADGEPGDVPTILVFGDSLSAGHGLAAGEGWVELLASRLAQRGYPHRVVNASISGDTTAGGVSRIEAALRQHRPALLILELGANDGLRGLSLTALKANLNSISERAKASGARVLLLGMALPPNYGPRYTERFSTIYGELAVEQQLPPPPFFLERVALDPALMQADNLHPNAAGQPLLLDTVWPVLVTLLER